MRVWISGCLVFALCLLTLPAQSAMAAAPYKYEDVWETESKVAIEFKENWDATSRYNMDKWRADKAFMALPDVSRRLYTRQARLAEALLAKYPNDLARREKGYQDLAENLFAAGMRQEGFTALKKLIDLCPGESDVAVSALQLMLLRLPWDIRGYTDRNEELVEFAANRLVALQQAGQLAKSHPAYALALRSLALLRREQGRMLEAWRALDLLDQAAGVSIWGRTQRADILYMIGRFDETLAMYRELASQTDDANVQGRHAELQAYRPADQPKFSRKMAVEVDCESLAGRDLKDQVQTIQKIILSDAAGAVPLVREMPATSVWAYLDRTLLAQDAAMLTKLRQSQQQAAHDAQRIGAAAEVRGLGLFRRYPWADLSHKALLEHGQDLLLEGKAQSAARDFQDAMTHTSDPALRKQAQAGLLMAVSQMEPSAQMVDEAFKGVDANLSFEWQGRQIKAQDIRQRLAASAASSEPAVLNLPVANVMLPPASSWSINPMTDGYGGPITKQRSLPALVPAGNDLVVGGPTMLACYGSDLGKPRWAVQPRPRRGFLNEFTNDVQPRYYQINPTAVAPVAADGRIFSRWGIEISGRFFEGLAAFDQADGRQIWSTADDKAWQDLWPVNDPVAAEGMLYNLAVAKGLTPFMTTYLVCTDARSGKMVWKKTIVSNDPSIQGTPPTDMVHFGNPVTLSDGAIYCQTNMGAVARFDVRDGVLEWAQVYSRAVPSSYYRDAMMRRQGAAPVVAGDVVVFMPRDFVGMLGVSRSTGKVLWQNPLAPSESFVGQRDGVLVAYSDKYLAAVDCRTGVVIWQRPLTMPIRSASLQGGTVVVDTAKDIQQFSVRDGTSLSQQPWKEPTLACAIRGNQLLTITPASANTASNQPLNPQAQEQGLSLPLTQHWFLPRTNVKIIQPPKQANLPDRVLLVSQDAIECLTPTAKGQINWRLQVEGAYDLDWADKKMLLFCPDRVMAVSLTDGRVLWQTIMPFVPRRHLVFGPYLAMTVQTNSTDRYGRRTAVLNHDTGQILWDRHYCQELTYPEWQYVFDGLAFDGQNLSLFGRVEPAGTSQVIVRPTDGTILDVRPLNPPYAGGGVVFDGQWLVMVDAAKNLVEYDVTGKTPAKPYAIDAKQIMQTEYYNWSPEQSLRMINGWGLMQHRDIYGRQNENVAWVIRKGDPSYQLRINGTAELQGDWLSYLTPTGIVGVHLPTKRQVALTPPPSPDEYGRLDKLLGVFDIGGRLMAFTGWYHVGYGWPMQMRVDLFDANSGAPIAHQTLDDVLLMQLVAGSYLYSYGNQIMVVGQTVLVVDSTGVHALGHSPQAAPSIKPLVPTVCEPNTIRLDGLLDDWPQGQVLAFKDKAGQDGQLQVAMARTHVIFGLSCHMGQFQPRVGKDHDGSGQMIEFNLQCGPIVHKANLSLDEHGRLTVENLQVDVGGLDVQARSHLDPITGRLTIEIAVPANPLVWKQQQPAVMGPMKVSLTGWEGGMEIGAEPSFTVRAQLPVMDPAAKK